MKHEAIVAGGGAIEMEISTKLRNYSREITGKQQFIIAAVARALEIIPRQLCDNAGFDANQILNKLRQQHSLDSGTWIGVDIINETVTNTFDTCVWEPALVKIN
ncbi:TCP-1/cpn60 chaperonin family protein, partial [Salmonella sp. s51228]|uniref:TCP-1/cpn60 chaperonin family protein n=1 Tax=Salmonella sp. s51228 TaxID=3159652 RepID=UPI0039809918